MPVAGPSRLPGLTISPRRGPGSAPGRHHPARRDHPVVPARGLLDNLGGTGERYLSQAEVETWIADLVAAPRRGVAEHPARSRPDPGRRDESGRRRSSASIASSLGPRHGPDGRPGDRCPPGTRPGASPTIVPASRRLLASSRRCEAIAPEPLPALPPSRRAGACSPSTRPTSRTTSRAPSSRSTRPPRSPSRATSRRIGRRTPTTSPGPTGSSPTKRRCDASRATLTSSPAPPGRDTRRPARSARRPAGPVQGARQPCRIVGLRTSGPRRGTLRAGSTRVVPWWTRSPGRCS